MKDAHKLFAKPANLVNDVRTINMYCSELAILRKKGLLLLPSWCGLAPLSSIAAVYP